MPEPILELIGIGKAYPGVVALSNVSLSVAPGEVVGLIGENGAGKSTLMKILGGVVAPSAGAIRVGGAPEREALTRERGDRRRHRLRPPGAQPLRQSRRRRQRLLRPRADARRPRCVWSTGHPLATRVQALLDRLGVDFRPDTPVADLSLAQRQLVEIVKALSLDARVVIMDEPTSSLTVSETQRLLKIVADLKASGVSIIFISHRLNEIESCADRVVVLRDGAVVGHLEGERHQVATR